MENKRIIQLLQNPRSLKITDKKCIDEELEKYPFAQSFKILNLKWKQLFSSEELKNEIEKASIYSTHRELLREITEKPIEIESTLATSESDSNEVSAITPYEEPLKEKEKTVLLLSAPEILQEENKEPEMETEKLKESSKNESSERDKEETVNESETIKNTEIKTETPNIQKLGISHLFSDKESKELNITSKTLSEEEEFENIDEKIISDLTIKKEPDENFNSSVIEEETKNISHEILENNLAAEKNIENLENLKEKIEDSKMEEDSKAGSPINENIITPIEKLTFSEWISLSNEKNYVISQKIIPTQEKQKNIIKKFIETNPKIATPKKEQKIKKESDLKKDEIKDIANLMTTTLANLYVEQGKYDTAITAFKILSLKYPEKSSYFASQIKKIKKIKNSK